jgi:hypothetical protein
VQDDPSKSFTWAAQPRPGRLVRFVGFAEGRCKIADSVAVPRIGLAVEKSDSKT